MHEVISLVVFVGYSVTYALHIAHNYNQMREDDQDLRAAEADLASTHILNIS